MSDEKFVIIYIDPGILMALTDGIFGMVMTLLIFGIELPLGEFTSKFAFQSFFIGIFPMLAR